MCGGFALLDHSLLAKVSPKDTPINFISKDGCLKRSYGGGGGGGGGVGNCRINMTGMLVISLRGVNRRFWSQSGCLGRKGNIFVHAGVT